MKVDLTRFEIDPARGLVLWAKPSKYHSRLTGTAAGFPQLTRSGKQYQIIKYGREVLRRSYLVFYFVNGRWPKDQIDHINGDSLDDRISNLREATHQQNVWNRKPRMKRPLPMGVRVTRKNKFVARIAYRKRKIHIGTYDTPKAAHLAYLKKRKELFGEFA